MEEELLKHLSEKYPEEGCGIVVNCKGKLKWLPCDNVAKDPLNDFVISPQDYAKAYCMGDIHEVIHSHPDAPPSPSESDKTSSEYLGVPFRVISIPSCEQELYTPSSKTSDLLGRDYEFGVNDCYSLVVDYYKTLGISIPKGVYEDDFWEKGLDYFTDLSDPYGFYRVEDFKVGDVLVFSVYSPIPNHCGVYIGNDLFMHHAVNRLSCRESIYSFWNKYITGIYRCKQYT